PVPEDNLPEETAQPFKRRKFYRKRLGSPSSESGSAAFPATNNTIASSYTAPEQLAQNSSLSDAEQHITGLPQRTVAEILKHRKAAQRRRGGIEFTNSTHVGESSIDTAAHADQLLDNEDSLGKILTVVDRFAPQTGQVADVDKHMYAAPKSSVPPLELQILTVSDDQSSGDDLFENTRTDLAKHRQPAALGKLHEIDLGLDATLKNIARTEAAKRRLEGGEPEIEESTGKVRLRKDGKPWRSRRRRNSDDVKRDKLVEEVMKESRLEIYDEPEVNVPNDDQAADDRIAEQFRKEFMDAISSRRKRSAQSKKDPKAKADDKPRGPKLGGSRSARAAMREMQQKSAKK
ncbi:MAG: hypothetical protein Q9193_006629, partial [Seirophora villosa]